jgi:hypothetical protein
MLPFTGNSFIDRSPDPLSRLGDYSLADFESYFVSLRQSEKYGRPRLVQQATAGGESSQMEKNSSTVNIPQLFLSAQFSLADASTFNLVFPGLIPAKGSHVGQQTEQQKSRTTSTSSDKSDGSSQRQTASGGQLRSVVRLVNDGHERARASRRSDSDDVSRMSVFQRSECERQRVEALDRLSHAVPARQVQSLSR